VGKIYMGQIAVLVLFFLTREYVIFNEEFFFITSFTLAFFVLFFALKGTLVSFLDDKFLEIHSLFVGLLEAKAAELVKQKALLTKFLSLAAASKKVVASVVTVLEEKQRALNSSLFGPVIFFFLNFLGMLSYRWFLMKSEKERFFSNRLKEAMSQRYPRLYIKKRVRKGVYKLIPIIRLYVSVKGFLKHTAPRFLRKYTIWKTLITSKRLRRLIALKRRAFFLLF